MKTIPSQTLPVIIELLDAAKPRAITNKFGDLLTAANSIVQGARIRSVTHGIADPPTAAAMRSQNEVIDPVIDELLAYFSVGYALRHIGVGDFVPGFTQEERSSLHEAGNKLQRLIQKQWKDGNKTEGTKLYDSIRSLG